MKPDIFEYPKDKCPRCDGEWKLPIFPEKSPRYFESDCGMRKSISGEQDVNAFVLPIGSKKLGWLLDEQKCVYGSTEEVIDGTSMELPWLAFSITPEELKKLIGE